MERGVKSVKGFIVGVNLWWWGDFLGITDWASLGKVFVKASLAFT